MAGADTRAGGISRSTGSGDVSEEPRAVSSGSGEAIAHWTGIARSRFGSVAVGGRLENGGSSNGEGVAGGCGEGRLRHEGLARGDCARHGADHDDRSWGVSGLGLRAE